jgi:hypothetical protein
MPGPGAGSAPSFARHLKRPKPLKSKNPAARFLSCEDLVVRTGLKGSTVKKYTKSIFIRLAIDDFETSRDAWRQIRSSEIRSTSRTR